MNQHTSYVSRDTLIDVIGKIDAALSKPARLYLIGESSQLFEGARSWTSHIDMCAEVAPSDRDRLETTIARIKHETGIDVFNESPADIIPLPDGYGDRMRRVEDLSLERCELFHFDPISVAFRYIARGDEPDYHIVLTYLQQGWLTMEKMNESLEATLPRFTSETIQQDPAEFRRKYKGMTQMWRAGSTQANHRRTPA